MNPRAALAHALLTRVAGPEPDEARDRIHLTPGPRWFDPDSPIGRVHGDASMFVGGVRALLLQSLHPLVMTAVAEHSGYRQDPWGRLQNTATFIAATTFGTETAAERAIAIVKAVHKRVVGTMPDGTPYAAGDPHLLSWVHLGEAERLSCWRTSGSGGGRWTPPAATSTWRRRRWWRGPSAWSTRP